jgi:hypothetical protein
MSYDLAYTTTPCDHRYVDDLIQDAVNIASDVIIDGSFYGETVYGTGIYGDDVYSIANPYFGNTGSYFVDNNRVVAIIPLTFTAGSNVSLFAKELGTYQRESVPQSSQVAWGSTGLYCGTGLSVNQQITDFLNDIITANGFGFYTTTTIQPMWYVNYGNSNQSVDITGEGDWYTVPPNNILISYYSNEVQWIADYNCVLNTCPVCSGTGMKNDISFGTLGRLNLVYGTAKLSQMVTKAILTPKGTNDYFPNYGTNLIQSIGSTNFGQDFVLRSEIFTQLQTIKDNYDQAVTGNPLNYTPSELLQDLLGVDLAPTADPRAMVLVVHLLTKGLDQISTQQISIVG